MADLKISQLTGATTPLAGTEVLPIVQSSTTKKVATDDLTVKNVRSNATTGILQIAGPGTGTTRTMTTPNANFTAARTDAGQTFSGLQTFSNGGNENISVFDGSSVKRTTFQQNDANLYINLNDTLAANGNIIVRSSNTFATKFTLDGVNGNFVIGTAAKGINFTANTPAAGMTSQLLNWYEEGTWTPAQGGGLTVVGAFSSTGKYTRIGRQIIISGTVTGATSVAVTAAGVITTNLPFTVGTSGHGNATNAAINAFAAVICTTTNVTSAGAIAATATITFSATYFV